MAGSLKNVFMIGGLFCTLLIVTNLFTPTLYIHSLPPKLRSFRIMASVTATDGNDRSPGVNKIHTNVAADADENRERSWNKTTRQQDSKNKGTKERHEVGVIPPFLGLPNSAFRSPYHRYWETNCSLVFKQDMSVINATTKLIESSRVDPRTPLVPTDEQFSRYTQNCFAFRRNRKYPTRPLSKEEEEFPLAYIITTHKEVAQVERLLRAIYQPQNIYCIHPDSKSPPTYQEAIKGLVSCFENVFIPSKVERVQYAGYTRLQADINCMKDLLQKPVQWKYLMNLCGQDFPLKTNLETVRQLKAGLNHNFMETKIPTRYKQLRTKYHYVTTGDSGLRRTEEEKTPPPYNFTLYTGSAYNAFTRAFVDYVIHDVRAIALLKWSEDTKTPDEHYWATLQGYPGVPGGDPNVQEQGRVFKFVKWSSSKNSVQSTTCIGKNVRGVCVFGIGYLKYLLSQPHVFANKFHYDFDPVAIQCLEEMLDYRQRYPESIHDFVREFPITRLVWKDV